MTTMTVRPPVVDLARRAASLQPELGEAVDRVVRSGWFLLGPETEAFEAEFAAFCGRLRFGGRFATTSVTVCQEESVPRRGVCAMTRPARRGAATR